MRGLDRRRLGEWKRDRYAVTKPKIQEESAALELKRCGTRPDSPICQRAKERPAGLSRKERCDSLNKDLRVLDTELSVPAREVKF